MDSLQDCTRAYLEASGCRCRREEEGGSLYTFAARGEHGVYPVLVYARAPFLICIASFRQTVPDARRLEAAEYLHRINYGLLLGNFEMDYDEGEVRFRTSLMAEGSLTHEVLDRYIQMARGQAGPLRPRPCGHRRGRQRSPGRRCAACRMPASPLAAARRRARSSRTRS